MSASVLDASALVALLSATRAVGLSFGDRACIALAQRLGAEAMTADRSWGRIAGAIGARILLIR
jgi:PIN domain nuclease of toxin-antitoxin system